VVAAFGAVLFTLFQLFNNADTLDYLGTSNDFDTGSRLAGEYNPLTVLSLLAKPLEQEPALALQPLIWMAAALPAALLIRRQSYIIDFAGLVLANSILVGGYLLLPYIFTSLELPLSSFMKTFALCAIIQCGLLLISPRAAHQPTLSPRERT
jgi:hypothetical protein